ncbi:hypothetical protein IY974_05590 [Campylobacter volucris]|uniref:hypothetical protein n=1 Tax=Campylobacter volucris TaxID=1031542 RepID=UPI00189C9041|nr:hypothetical protein [Campylobacter volucris]MBF7046031.1 hypothetical protein [Campylobacter volucris]
MPNKQLQPSAFIRVKTAIALSFPMTEVAAISAASANFDLPIYARATLGSKFKILCKNDKNGIIYIAQNDTMLIVIEICSCLAFATLSTNYGSAYFTYRFFFTQCYSNLGSSLKNLVVKNIEKK